MTDRERKEKELELLLLQEKEESQEPVSQEQPVSGLESFGQGLHQGATLGFGEDISALTELGIGKLTDLSRNDPLYKDASYKDLRDAYRGDIKAAREANPARFGLGEFLGSAAATAPVGAAGTIGKAIKGGAALGGIGALGSTEKKDVSGIASDVATGTIGGAALSGILHPIAKLASAGKAIDDFSNEFAARTTGMQPGQVKRVGLEEFRKIGKLLQDEGIVNRTNTLKGLEQDVNRITSETGRKLDSLYTAASNTIKDGPATPTELVKHVQEKLLSKEQFYDPSTIKAVGEELTKLLSSQKLDKKLSIKDLWMLSRKLDSVTNRYGRSSLPADESLADGLYGATSEIRALTRSWLEQNNPKLAQMITPEAAKYSLIANAKQAVSGFRTRTAGKLINSFGGIVESPLIRTTVQAIAINPAKILKLVPPKFGRVLENAAKRGSTAFAATHFSLLQQNKEYRKALEIKEEEPVEVNDEIEE